MVGQMIGRRRSKRRIESSVQNLRKVAAGMGLAATLGVSMALSAHAQVGITNDSNSVDAAKIGKFEFDHVSCKGDPFEIRVVIEGVRRAEGLMTADLYPNNQEVFLRGRGRIELARYAAKAPHTKFCLKAPGPGLYAMAIYHDRNANRDFDKTGLGLPAEPWGLSNNPRGLFGPPPIEKALFEVTEDGATVAIELN